jgi:translation initiation factor 4A
MQMRAVVPCIQGHDTLVQAQSGTGKMCTFVIAVLQAVDPDSQQCQALVLVSVRESAYSVQKMFVALGCYMKKKVECMVYLGGNHLSRGTRSLIKEGGRVSAYESTL